MVASQNRNSEHKEIKVSKMMNWVVHYYEFPVKPTILQPSSSLDRFLRHFPPAALMGFFFSCRLHTDRFSGRCRCEIAVSNLLFLTFNFIILCICQMDPSSHRFINLLCLSHAHTSSDLLLSNLYLKREDLCVDGGDERSSVLSSVETT